jgi:integrase
MTCGVRLRRWIVYIYATSLLLADKCAKVVSVRLGHSTIQMTLNTYSHVLPTMQQQAAEKMDRLLKSLTRAVEA